LDRSRGFTLIEVVLVMALAAVVTLGIVGFYLQSQAMWIESSSQALAQRDATTMIEAISDSARVADFAVVVPVTGSPENSELYLFKNSALVARFFWVPADSLVHFGYGINPDQGPLAPTVVERFTVSYDPNRAIVNIDTLRVRTNNGTPTVAARRITLSSTIGLYNKWGS
jgi:prepilin-type N-terminal cleavage/methylation domain-containing protein